MVQAGPDHLLSRVCLGAALFGDVEERQGAFEELESVFGGAIIFMVYRSLWSINPCGRGVYSFHIAGMVVRPERAHSRGVHSFSARRGGVFIRGLP